MNTLDISRSINFLFKEEVSSCTRCGEENHEDLLTINELCDTCNDDMNS